MKLQSLSKVGAIVLSLSICACSSTGGVRNQGGARIGDESPKTAQAHGRSPANIDAYRAVEGSSRIFVAQIDRCGEIGLQKQLTSEEISHAAKMTGDIEGTLNALVEKVRTVNAVNGAIAQQLLMALRFLLDGADSVKCGGVADFSYAASKVDGAQAPTIALSLRGASALSWRTVVPHEFSHLLIKTLGFDGGPLREAWPDLLAISVNGYRPFFAEGDGERTLARVAANLASPQTSDAMRELYRYNCVSPRAQRDFSSAPDLNRIYFVQQIHASSCQFVPAFLTVRMSVQARDRLLYGYLFGQNRPSGGSRPRLSHSADMPAALNALLGTARFPSIAYSVDDSTAVVERADRRILVRVKIAEKTRDRVVRNTTRPISLQLEEPDGTTGFQWINFLDLHEPVATLFKVDQCVRSGNCLCASGAPLRLRLIYLDRELNKVSGTLPPVAVPVEKGCYAFQATS